MFLAIIVTFASSFFETNSTIERISVKITNILQILLFAGILISYQQYQDANKQNLLNQQSELAEKGWVQVYEEIQHYYDKCPNFCNSLSYEWQIPKTKGIHLKKTTDLNNPDDYGAVLSLSVLIFESFQNVLGYFLYYESDEKINNWLKSFIIWANSDILYDIWKSNKFIYDKSVELFANTIFKMVRVHRPKNEEEINNLATEICASKEMKQIFEKVEKKSPCQ